MIEDAIVTAIPHTYLCQRTSGKCICGAAARRAVLYAQIQDHMQKVTRYVYLR